jgi:tetratricopeptide (TPR) repeat protein
LQLAILKQRTGTAYGDVLAAYRDAIEYAPQRAEALCELARYLRQNQRYELARRYAHAASRLAAPPGVLILDSTVYDWRARDELAVASFYCGDRQISARLWRELLDDRRLPAEERARVQSNLDAAVAAAT